MSKKHRRINHKLPDQERPEGAPLGVTPQQMTRTTWWIVSGAGLLVLMLGGVLATIHRPPEGKVSTFRPTTTTKNITPVATGTSMTYASAAVSNEPPTQSFKRT